MKILNKLNQFFFFSLAASSLVLTACTADKDYEAYRQSQTDKKISQYKVAEGTYTGPVVSNLDGKSLGSMKLAVTVDKSSQQSSDQLGTETKAVIKAKLTYFVEGRELDISSENSGCTFDPDTKVFLASFPVGANLIKAEGIIQSGSFVGEVYMDKHREFGFKTSLTNNGSFNQADLDVRSARLAQLNFDNQSFLGELKTPATEFSGESSTPLKLSLSAPRSLATSEQLLRYLNPERMVSARFEMEIVKGTPWIQDLGSLTVRDIERTLMGGTSAYEINCNINAELDLRCDLRLNNSVYKDVLLKKQ